MFDTIKRALTAIAAVVGMCACANSAVPFPSPDTELNDVDPRIPLGRYIQYEASNTVAATVILTNGVLTVGNETINVAEPSHTVVTTNVIDGRLVIETNTYDAVYQDNLSQTLESYATIKKAVVTQNEDGTYTTNWVDVAYLNDLPPDDKKADKVINLWDYHCPQVGGTLTRAESKIAPFTAWSWDGNTNGIYHIDLMYTNGVWSCSVNAAAPPLTVRGDENAKALNFGDYTFKSTNENGVAYVVYTDALNKARKDFIENELVMFVSKTNMTGMAEAIQEDQLTTIQGIVDTLMGIRRELLDMSGNKGILLSFTNVTEGLTLTFGNADIQGLLGRVDINWGDGTKTATNFPCSHTYSGAVSGVVEVAISGRIKSISGSIDGATIYPFASWSDGDNEKLFAVSIDRTVGLEELGDYAFAYSTMKSLSFARDARVSKFGKYCFYSSGIDTLYGMPDIEEIPDYCFAKCGIQSMNGLAATVRSIGVGAFSDCTALRSLSGIGTTAGPQTLGDSAFANCTALVSMSGLDQTGITEIPDNCFSMCSSLASIAYLNPGTTKIGKNAFMGTAITTLNGMPQTISEIEDSAFQGCTGLTDARALWNTSLVSIGDMAFYLCPLRNVTFPESLSYLGSASLYGLNTSGASGDGYKATVKFRGKTLWESQLLPVSATNAAELGFSWGLPKAATNDTLIIGVDGEMYFDPVENIWVTNSTEIAFSMSGVPANTTVMLGNIIEAPTTRDAVFDGTDIMIDWGDGTSDYENQHTYTADVSPTIKVFGKVAGISGKSEAYPFIAISGSPTNTYLIGATFAKSDTIRTIGEYAFAGCTSLQSVDGLSSEISSLGTGCFRCASALSSLSFISGTEIDEIPSECFRGCSSITSLDGVPSSVATIGTGAFRECTSLASIEALPSSVTSIPQDAFRRCTSLTNVNGVAAGFTGIGRTAFAECIRVEEVSLNTSTTIAPLAFSDLGVDADTKTDEDGISYRTIYKFPNGTYYQAAQSLGLETASGDPSSGMNKYTSKIECADEEQLVWHSDGSLQRWEVLVPALEIELKDVTSNTTFEVARTWVASQASVLWNWGDGTSMWVSQSPSPHTYTHDGTKSYTIRIKGLLDSISAEGGAAGGAYIRPQGETENPFLVGFRLPDNTPMRSVGNYSFSRCPNLKNINRTNLPRSRALAPPVRREEPKTRLEQLFQSKATLPIEYGEFCFYGSGIEDLSGLPTNTTSLAVGLFSRNESLKSLETLPGDNITDMGAYCFEQTGVTNLFGYPSAIGYVGDYAFLNCYDLTTMAGLPNNITDIGEGSFASCTGITTLDGLPPSVIQIGTNAFFGAGLVSVTNLPEKVTSISECAFAKCDNMTILETGTNIVNIGSMAFIGCSNLAQVTISPSANGKLGDYGLYCNGNLRTVNFGRGMERIGYQALGGVGGYVEPEPDDDGNMVSCYVNFEGRSCDDIMSLWKTNIEECLQTTEFVGSDGYIVFKDGEWVKMINTILIDVNVQENAIVDIGSISTETNGFSTLFWGDESTTDENLESYQHRYINGGDYTITILGKHIDSLLTRESPRPFLSSTNSDIVIKSIRIGNNCGLAELGESCFRNYSTISNLWDMSYSSIQRIGPYCFDGCTSLMSLDGLPSSLSTFSTNSFSRCSSLTDISYLNNLLIKELPDGMFEKCTSLSNLSGIPYSVTNIGARAFASCTSIQNLRGLPSSVSMFGDHAFSNCTSLASIDSLTNTINSLGDGCFFGCTGLTSINTFTDTLPSLPDNCFRDCTALTSVTGLPSLVSLGANCFSNCTALSEIGGLMEGQEYVATALFAGCRSLPSLYFLPESIAAVSNSAFYGCTGLNYVKFYKPLEYVGSKAFGQCVNISNLVFTSAITNIGSSAMEAIGTNGATYTNELGFTYKARVTFTELSCSNITAIANFPFGAPLATTIFEGNDGTIAYVDGTWTTLKVAVMIDMTPYAGSTYSIGNIQLAPGGKASIIWGDGASSSITASGQSATHRYSTANPVSIWVNGDVANISYSGIGSFISIYANGQKQESNPCITSIRIPFGSSLKEIGDHAFYNCPNLESVYFNSVNLELLGDNAFSRNQSLTNIVFEQSVVTNFGNYCFYNSGMNDLNWIPDTVDSVGNGCFSECDNIKVLGDSISMIGELPYRCFYGCDGLGSDGSTVVCPASITNIGDSAFANCSKIRTFGASTMAGGIAATAFTDMGRGLATVKDDFGNTYRTRIYLTSNSSTNFVKKNDAGIGVITYTNIGTFPFGAPTNSCFCSSDGILTYKVKEMPTAPITYRWTWDVSTYCLIARIADINAGDKIRIGEIVPHPWKSYEVSFGDGNTAASLPAEHTFNSSYQECYVSIIGPFREIGIDATSSRPWISITGNGRLTSMEILDGSDLRNISDYSFYGCTGLTKFSVGSHAVTNVGTFAFAGCTSMEFADFSVCSATIGSNAFFNCTSLVDARFDSRSMKKMGANALKNIRGGAVIEVMPVTTNFVLYSKGGASYKLYNPETMLAHEILQASPSLWGVGTSVSFHAVNGTLSYSGGWKTFEDGYVWQAHYKGYDGTKFATYLDVLKEGDLRFVKKFSTTSQATLPRVGGYVKQNKMGKLDLTVNSVRIGNSIPLYKIGDYAFKECDRMTNITYGSSSSIPCSMIGQESFYGCSRLPIRNGNVTFPNCTEFGDDAFYECGSLTDISWMNANAIVGKECFYGCTQLTSISGFPSGGKKLVPEKCFMNCTKLPSLAGIPNQITNIQTKAFSGCTNLLDMSAWPSELVEIGDYAFGCSDDAENKNIFDGLRCKTPIVSLPRKLKKIGEYAFSGVSKNLYENTVFDISFSPINNMAASSFAGSPLLVVSSKSMATIRNWMVQRYKEIGLNRFQQGIINQNQYNSLKYDGIEIVQSSIPTGDILASDGLYKSNRMIRDYRYKYEYEQVKGEVGNTVVMNLKSVPANTTFYARKSTGLLYGLWGDKSYFTNSAVHTYTSSGNYRVVMVHKNKDYILDNPTEYPLVGTTSTSNPYVSSLSIGHVNSIGDFALAGLTKCETVNFYTDSNPTMGNHSFDNLGSDLTYKTVFTMPYKTLVDTKGISSSVFMASPFPYGMPTNTVISANDGYVRYKNDEWGTAVNVTKYRVNFSLEINIPQTTSYEVTGSMKYAGQVRGIRTPQYAVLGFTSNGSSIIGHNNNNYVIGILPPYTVRQVEAPQIKNFVNSGNYTQMSITINQTLEQEGGENLLNALEEAGILREKSTGIWEAKGSSAVISSYVYHDVNLTITRRKSPSFKRLPQVTCGPFYWKDNKPGQVRFHNLKSDPAHFPGVLSTVNSGEELDVWHVSTGVTDMEIIIYGELQRIGKFLSQDTSGITVSDYACGAIKPSIVSYDWGDMPSVSRIDSWSYGTNPAEANIPSTVTYFGAGCFSSLPIVKQPTNLNWLPPNIETIGTRCFQGWKWLSMEGLGKYTSLRTIGEAAFSGCESLGKESLEVAKTKYGYIPSSVTTIGNRAFENTWGSSTDNARNICFKGKSMSTIKAMSGYPWLTRDLWGTLKVGNTTVSFESSGGLSLPRYRLYGSNGYISAGDEETKQNTGL